MTISQSITAVWGTWSRSPRGMAPVYDPGAGRTGISIMANLQEFFQVLPESDYNSNLIQVMAILVFIC
jgi:hypothetical protein